MRAAVIALVETTDWSALSWVDLMPRLAAFGRTDVVAAKLAESHIDAARILGQAEAPHHAGLYGVWASRSRASGVSATLTEGAIAMTGTVRFASGAGIIDRVLLPVWLASGEHLLLDLDPAGWIIDDSQWRTTAMAASRSYAVTVSGSAPRGSQVGPPSWYLERPAFEPGGVGVAAVWVGAAARVVDLLDRSRSDARESETAQLRRGQIRRHLATAGATLAVAATRLDDAFSREHPETDDIGGVVTEARAITGASVRAVLALVRDLAGPAGLAFDGELTAAVADLDLYVRQQPGDPDDLRLGAQ